MCSAFEISFPQIILVVRKNPVGEKSEAKLFLLVVRRLRRLIVFILEALYTCGEKSEASHRIYTQTGGPPPPPPIAPASLLIIFLNATKLRFRHVYSIRDKVLFSNAFKLLLKQVNYFILQSS